MRRATPQRRQAGVALLMALLIVSLVASVAAAMVWRQYRAIQIEAAERARAQAGWILQGALDWARLILREDARANQTTPVDHLGEVWAVPLAEARLSTFLAADKGHTDEGPEAFLSGTISDAQAQYNLRNLLGGSAAPPQQLQVLERLCEGAGVPPETAALITLRLRGAYAPQIDEASAMVEPVTLDQLAWLGLSADTIERLRPLVVMLPFPTTVNLNTAPREVIAALFDGMDLASAERLVQGRKSAPLQSVPAAQAFLPATVRPDPALASVQSAFFFVTGRLRLEERVLQQRSLIFRNGLSMETRQRQQINQVLPPQPDGKR